MGCNHKPDDFNCTDHLGRILDYIHGSLRQGIEGKIKSHFLFLRHGSLGVPDFQFHILRYSVKVLDLHLFFKENFQNFLKIFLSNLKRLSDCAIINSLKDDAYGRLAQLGERRVRNAEVKGSNPSSSTT